MFILYYDPGMDEQEQWFVPPGEPLDQLASTLGVIAMSLEPFHVPVGTGSPPLPDWNPKPPAVGG